MNDAILPDDNNLDPNNYYKYFDANPLNTIELDTYIVHPDYREKGLVRIVPFEGLKIQIKKLLEKRPDLKEIFICFSIHRNNSPLNMVAQSFVKCDILYVKRRTGINRDVYFYKIQRNSLDELMKINEDKINELKLKIKNVYNIELETIELK